MEYFCLLTFCLNSRTILHCLVWTPCPSGGWNEFFVYRKVDLSRTRPKLRLWLRTLTRRWVQKSIIRLFRISSPNCLVSTRRTSGASSTMSTTWNISSPCQRSGYLQQLRKMPIAINDLFEQVTWQLNHQSLCSCNRCLNCRIAGWIEQVVGEFSQHECSVGRAAYGSPDAGCGDSERPQGQKMEGQSLEEMIAASFSIVSMFIVGLWLRPLKKFGYTEKKWKWRIWSKMKKFRRCVTFKRIVGIGNLKNVKLVRIDYFLCK